jgi:ATP-dependent exoDNAse (exonuclease V) beta subunit
LRRLKLVADHRANWKASGCGTQANWDDVTSARRATDAVGEVAAQVCTTATDVVLRNFAIRLARFTRDAAGSRRAEGRLDFHDLLVLARRLVRRSPSARATLHQRYQRLLLDEFQDTDPIQIEVAVLIATAVEDGEIDRPWPEIAAEKGRLFFVGDPKQSIYRFRRADIGLFLHARHAFSGSSPVRLRQNFRTVEPVLDWVNHVFGVLMAEEVEGAQARYQPLSSFRDSAAADHRVVLLGGERDLSAGDLRAEEASAVAGAVVAVRDDPGEWPVYDRGAEVWRAPRMADVTILVPTRTSLRQLEDALDAERVPYRVATGSLVYDTQEVREVLDALRAVDDPGDGIALVSALRSPLYACSDVELFTYYEAGGRWDLRRRPPAGIAGDHPVVLAMQHLRSLWEIRWWHEPSALLDRLLRERRVFALAFSHRRPREVWRRLRFLVDQARAFEEVGGGGLRAFLDWAELQRREGTRTHEPLMAETDDDAVSILTVHGAKGLEFPITILSGATTQVGAARAGVQVLWDGELPEIKLRKDTATDHFDRLADIEVEMDVHERARLLYVACTRARDHLVVSTFHRPGKASYGAWLAQYSAGVEGRLCRRLPARQQFLVMEPTVGRDEPADDDRQAWVVRRQALLDEQGQPRFVSATAIAHADEATDDTGDAQVVPGTLRRRGRAGTAIGRAVHATLQFLAPGDDDRIDALSTQHAHLEAVPEATATVAALVRSARQAPAVRAALVARRSWRELYVAAPVGERAIEGYIDLLYETDAGLVLVDYKTDAVASEAGADAKAARYGLQAAAYALALEISTGLAVASAHLVFCTTGAPVQRTVADLAAAKEEVRRRIAV